MGSSTYQVKPIVDSGCGDSRINEHALASFWQDFDVHFLPRDLFCNEWRYIRFEAAGSYTHDDNADDEGGKR